MATVKKVKNMEEKEQEQTEVMPPPESKKIKLDFPVTHPDGEEITEILLRRLKARELKGVSFKQGAEIGAMLKLVGVMASLPDAVMDELDASDALNVCGEAAPFLGVGDGTKPSP